MSDPSSTSSRSGASLQVSVIFNGRVQADVDAALARESSAESGGVLVGTADPALGLVVVLGSEPLPTASQTSRSVEFTPALWAHMVDLVLDHHPGQRIVGWYHSHVGSGVFLSGHDLLIHSTFFSQPWQVAYVVDPTRDERGLFAWRGHDVVRVEHWDVTSGAQGVATSVAPNEPEGRATVLRHLAQPVIPRTGSTEQVSAGAPAAPSPLLVPAPTPEPAKPVAEPPKPVAEPPKPVHEPVHEPVMAAKPVEPVQPVDVRAGSDSSTWGYPLGKQPDDDTEPIDRPAAAAEADEDLDAWIASLPTSAEAGAAAFAAFDGPRPRAANELTHQEVEAVAGAVIEADRRPRRRLLIASVVAVLVAAIVLVVVLTSGSDDNKGASPTTIAVPVTLSTVTIPAPTTTARATTTAAPTTERTEPADVTEPSTSSSAAPTTTVAPTTTITTATLPPTPSAVTTPSERVGDGASACPLGSNGLYTPVANCFVALPNGNIVADLNDSLICVDPAGPTLAAATPFLVGFGGDPLAVIADGVALARCEDLSYAKNVMAAGAPTFPGLCGNNNTTINQNSTRCFAANPSTGAIAALTAALGTDNGLAGLCFSASGQPVPVALTWTTPGVDASWRIVSVAFEPGIQQFVATANRSGEVATTIMACA